MFVHFYAVQKTKRIEHKQSGGVLTWGNMPSPIEKFSGPTSRRALQASVLFVKRKSPEGESPSGLDSDPDSGRKAESLGNGSRDDKTPLGLFYIGVQAIPGEISIAVTALTTRAGQRLEPQ